MQLQTTCIHDIFAEWCSICKHVPETSVKQLVLEDNIEIVENILSWNPDIRIT